MSTLSRLIDNVAVCSARLSANSYISISANDLKFTNMEPGDELRVVLIKAGKPTITQKDTYTYINSLQKSNQVYVPKGAKEALDLQTGDIIRYIAFSRENIPRISTGPLRKIIEKARDEDDVSTTSSNIGARPERESTTDNFTANMFVTGQFTVPADTMDKLGLIQGDSVMLTVTHSTEATGQASFESDIGSSNRALIPKEQRDKLELEKGDEVNVEITVPSSIPDGTEGDESDEDNSNGESEGDEGSQGIVIG
mgnify:CR=1 FL=1